MPDMGLPFATNRDQLNRSQIEDGRLYPEPFRINFNVQLEGIDIC